MIQSERFELPVKVRVKEGERAWAFDYHGTNMLTIGRADECDIVLATERASRRHAQIFGEGGLFTVLDAGSSNGIVVNGEKVERKPLRPGDRIQIGNAIIQFGDPGAAMKRAVKPAKPAAAGQSSGGNKANGGAKAPSAGAPAQPAKAAKPARAAAATAEPGDDEQEEAPQFRKPNKFLNQVVPALLLLVILILVVLYMLERNDNINAAKEANQSAAATDPSTTETSDADEIDPWEGDIETHRDSARAIQAFQFIIDEMRAGRTGWQGVRDLKDFSKMFPGSHVGTEAGKLASILEGIQGRVGQEGRETTDKTLEQLIESDRLGAAITVCSFLSNQAEADAEKKYWADRKSALETDARQYFNDMEKDLGDLVSEGKAGDALKTLLDLQNRYAGTEIYTDLLGQYARQGIAAEERVVAKERPFDSTEGGILLDRAVTAFAECRFRDLEPIYHRYLTLGPPPAERIEALEHLVEAPYLVAMFNSFIDGVGEELDVSMSDKHESKVIGADEAGIKFQIRIGGGTITDDKEWRVLSQSKKFELFNATSFKRDAILGLAFFSQRIGFEEGFHTALIRLQKRKGGEELVAAVLSNYLGVPVPDSGYIAYKGRLVTPQQKEAILIARSKEREEEKERKRQLKLAKQGKTLAAAIDHAKNRRMAGRYEYADRLLREVAARKKKFPEESAEAQRLLDNPYLSHHVMVETGPRENRLEFVFMAEGFQVDDEFQEKFNRTANTCMQIFTKDEPYRDYLSYFNFYRMHLGSKDSGVDRPDQNIFKDTALNAKIEGGAITSDASRVKHFLYDIMGPKNDGQGIMLANDSAGTQTGGGGVVNLTLDGLSACSHEIGHALGGVGDEYTQDPFGSDREKRDPSLPAEVQSINIMKGGNKRDVIAKAPWKYWIDAGESKWWNNQPVSAYEGANRQPYNYWRPQQSCMMRTSGTRFCCVCMERMVLQIYAYVRPIDKVDPDPNERIKLGAKDSVLVKVWPMKPESRFLETRWFLKDMGLDMGDESPRGSDGASGDDDDYDDDDTGRTSVGSGRSGLTQGNEDWDEIDRGEILRRFYRTQDAEGRWVEIAQVQTKKLRAGRYILRCEVVDTTEWVIRDPGHLLKDAREWEIIVSGD